MDKRIWQFLCLGFSCGVLITLIAISYLETTSAERTYSQMQRELLTKETEDNLLGYVRVIHDLEEGVVSSEYAIKLLNQYTNRTAELKKELNKNVPYLTSTLDHLHKKMNTGVALIEEGKDIDQFSNDFLIKVKEFNSNYLS